MAGNRSKAPRDTTGSARISPKFLILFALLLLPAAAIWFFYRWLFPEESSVMGAIFLTAATAWLWAYLLGYGRDSTG